jgi:hypothetical protein
LVGGRLKKGELTYPTLLHFVIQKSSFIFELLC